MTTPERRRYAAADGVTRTLGARAVTTVLSAGDNYARSARAEGNASARRTWSQRPSDHDYDVSRYAPTKPRGTPARRLPPGSIPA
jgi:hypothetical protein